MNQRTSGLAAAIVAALSGHAWASESEHREHDAHVHGVASLNLAVEASEVIAELQAPAMNIVGFEHAPRNEQQHQAVKQAAASLKQGESWLILPAGAGCRLEAARVESSLLDDEQSAGGDHEASHDDDHDGHDDNSHDEDHDEVHSEFHVSLVFHCDDPGVIDAVQVGLFDEFPGMEKIELQAITQTRQIGGNLTPGNAVINLSE